MLTPPSVVTQTETVISIYSSVRSGDYRPLCTGQQHRLGSRAVLRTAPGSPQATSSVTPSRPSRAVPPRPPAARESGPSQRPPAGDRRPSPRRRHSHAPHAFTHHNHTPASAARLDNDPKLRLNDQRYRTGRQSDGRRLFAFKAAFPKCRCN